MQSIHAFCQEKSRKWCEVMCFAGYWLSGTALDGDSALRTEAMQEILAKAVQCWVLTSGVHRVQRCVYSDTVCVLM